ncbi:unnamed protein product, partial [Urochloa humidicola]
LSRFISGEAWGGPAEQQPADFGNERRDAWSSSAELARRGGLTRWPHARRSGAMAAALTGERHGTHRRASCAAANPGRSVGERRQVVLQHLLEVVAAIMGTRFDQYIDWIRFSLYDQMLARHCSR